jgi:hypothetical protein
VEPVGCNKVARLLDEVSGTRRSPHSPSRWACLGYSRARINLVTSNTKDCSVSERIEILLFLKSVTRREGMGGLRLGKQLGRLATLRRGDFKERLLFSTVIQGRLAHASEL